MAVASSVFARWQESQRDLKKWERIFKYVPHTYVYHMKIEEITSKTQKLKEMNSPWISPQRVENITFAKKFITIPVSEKEDGQLSIYNVSVGTRMQFCMDLKLSKRNVQPLTIKRWIWAPIAIAQWGLNHFETKLEFPKLFSRSSMKWKVLCFWKLSAHLNVTLTPFDGRWR